jgi:fucose 4-O-acetylase-like acetyltransferase
MAEKKRISYYDVAKGILICLVILWHIFIETLYKARIPNTTFTWLRNYQWVYTSFFMPAFFIITGLCSNFNKPFNQFLKTNFKTLIIPAIFFDIFCYTIPNIYGNHDITNELYNFIYRVFTMGGKFWFLPCLFWSKIIFWCINKYTKGFLSWGILVILFIFGFVIDKITFPLKDWWYICQVFDMTIFIGVGHSLKKVTNYKDYLYYFGTIIFVVSTIYFLISKDYFPSVFSTYNIYEWKQLPIHFVISIAGTLTLLFICEKINNNSILEYLGRGTIVVYGVNNIILKIILRPLAYFIAYRGFVVSSIMIIVLLIITVALSAIAIQLFNLKYLRPVLGKTS